MLEFFLATYWTLRVYTARLKLERMARLGARLDFYDLCLPLIDCGQRMNELNAAI